VDSSERQKFVGQRAQWQPSANAMRRPHHERPFRLRTRDDEAPLRALEQRTRAALRAASWGRLLLAALQLTACGPKPEHPDAAPPCEPSQDCTSGSPLPPLGSIGGGNEAGAGSGDEQTAQLSGGVFAFVDDAFDTWRPLTTKADVSADGKSAARVSGSYDGLGFTLDDVLKGPANWFQVEPAAGSGFLPTLSPVDTRTRASGLEVGVVSGTSIDGIFLASSGTERSDGRAQIVLRVVDDQGRSLSGVTGKVTAEVTSYRAAGSWVGVSAQNTTDDSGLMFFGNVPAGSALTEVPVTLGGATTASVVVVVRGGSVSVVTVAAP
jgi:hypothetical protein